MHPDELIESYVHDVAAHLPHRQRNDVAFELRALLNEELQAKAGTEGRAFDESMTMELLRSFGRPQDVASRYHPGLTIIDPADGRSFFHASVIGLAVIWLLGLIITFSQPDGTVDFYSALARWWASTAIPSLWWPGLLVLCYGLAAWTRHRWPATARWKPRVAHHKQVNRPLLILCIAAIVFGIFILIDPAVVLDVMFDGRAAPAAYDAFTYTDSFLDRQAFILLLLLSLNIPLLLSVMIRGHWTPATHQLDIAMSVLTCLALAWTVLDGNIVVQAESDRFIKFCMVLIIMFVLLDAGIKLYRAVKPSPSARPLLL